MRRTVAILGIPVDDLTSAQVLERLDEFVQSRRFHQVATANTDFLIKAQSDPELKAILRTADMVVPDGMPIVWASRILRTGLPERVTGADLVPALAELAARKGYRIFMLGGEPEVAGKARKTLEERNPGLQIVGCESPDLPNVVTTRHDALLSSIAAADPDILLVAFGNPKQEKWIHMNRNRLKAPVCIGVGGTFDFLAGRTKRAPVIMQRLGLEFVYRWRQNPRRLGSRYRNDLTRFPPLIMQQIRWMMRGDRGALPRITHVRREDCTIISVHGALGLRGLVEFQRHANAALNVGTDLVLDFGETTRLDSAALGTLLNLRKRAAWVGRDMRLTGLNGRLKRIVWLSGADGLLSLYDSLEEAVRAKPGPAFTISIGEAEGNLGMMAMMRGRADVEFAECAKLALAEIPESAVSLAIDMSEVTYIDCAMLAAIHQYAENWMMGGRDVRLVQSPAVSGAIQREGIADAFQQPASPGPVPRIEEGATTWA